MCFHFLWQNKKGRKGCLVRIIERFFVVMKGKGRVIFKGELELVL